MALDPSIILQGRPAPIQNPLELGAQVAQLQQIREQTEIRRLAAEEARTKHLRQEQIGEAWRQALRHNSETGAVDIDENVLFQHLPGDLIPGVRKEFADDRESAAKLQKARQEVAALTTQHLQGAARTVKEANYDPQVWGIELWGAHQLGTIDDATYERYRTLAPDQIKTVVDSALTQGQAPKAGESFTLSPGQTRYGPTGEPIASNAAASGEAKSETRSIAVQAADAYLRGDMDTYKKLVTVSKEVNPPVPTYQWVTPPGAAPGTPPVLMTPPEIRSSGAEKPLEPPTQAQSSAAGYAARMAQAEPTFTEVTDEIRKMGLLPFQAQTNSWFAKPTFQSPAVQKYMQAARNFINANLRRESGAVISPKEFSEAKAQYLPQPDDTDDVKAQKAANRAQVFENIKREAGRAYQPPVTADQEKKTDDSTTTKTVGEGAFSVKAPDGVTYRFKTAAALAAYKQRVGLR